MSDHRHPDRADPQPGDPADAGGGCGRLGRSPAGPTIAEQMFDARDTPSACRPAVVSGQLELLPRPTTCTAHPGRLARGGRGERRPRAVHPPRRQPSRHRRVQRPPVHRDGRPRARPSRTRAPPARGPCARPTAAAPTRRPARARGRSARPPAPGRSAIAAYGAVSPANQTRQSGVATTNPFAALGRCGMGRWTWTAGTSRTRTSEPGTVHQSCSVEPDRVGDPLRAQPARVRGRGEHGAPRAAAASPSSAWSWCRCDSSTASGPCPVAAPRRGAPAAQEPGVPPQQRVREHPHAVDVEHRARVPEPAHPHGHGRSPAAAAHRTSCSCTASAPDEDRRRTRPARAGRRRSASRVGCSRNAWFCAPPIPPCEPTCPSNACTCPARVTVEIEQQVARVRQPGGAQRGRRGRAGRRQRAGPRPRARVVPLEQHEPARADRDQPAIARVDDDDADRRPLGKPGDQARPALLQVLERQPVRHPREPHEAEVARADHDDVGQVVGVRCFGPPLVRAEHGRAGDSSGRC